MVQQARLFAIAAHGATGQRRKGTLEPYIVHPEAVAGIVALFGGDEAMQAAAWLHDVVEDTELDLDTIEQAFGTDVATLVSAVTKPEAEGQGRADRVATARASLASASYRAQTIKLADIFHNLSGSENLTKAFRKIYLPEKKGDVEAMQKADERLQGMLKELLATLTQA
ncbi:HD domain-containing protein [Halomonas sp. I5-271120]|uniref:HD domain-containing protein n=1 Tax=Halomonas sp. I5-271120 TaxID=3061632 RepID=UPI0027152A28|nr:HD domain-containing protein [Halomonas sp. I5-271120]